jgi:heme oxygenase
MSFMSVSRSQKADAPLSVNEDPSAHAGRKLGPRVRKLHARMGAAHRQAEGMVFSRALLAGEVSPLQLAALVRALQPAYARMESLAPQIAAELGARDLPWSTLNRTPALHDDVVSLAGLGATPVSPAAAAWLVSLEDLARHAPHRFLAHVYVRYGGDLSGGQQLGGQANGVLARHGLAPLAFWSFDQPVEALKHQLHGAFEALELSDLEEEELLLEAELAFAATQRLLAELADLAPATAPLAS